MTIQELIDAQLANKEEHKPSGKWAVSRFGRCYRFQFWKRKGEKETNPPDARTLRVFEAGHLFHKFVQDIIVKSNEQAEIEKFIEIEDIVGFADVVNGDTVWDIKSQHSKAFWYMKREGYDIRKEKYTNWLQVMSYAWMMDKQYGRLVFVSKDDLCIEEHGEVLSAYWKEEINREIAVLRGYWDRDELPKAEPRAYGGAECKYCSYSSKCKELEQNG